jgi:CRISPR-associated protein Csm5
LLGIEGSAFETDPFRQIALADAFSAGGFTQVLFAVDRDRDVRIDRRTGMPSEKNLFVAREVVAPAQFRGFEGEIRLNFGAGSEQRDRKGRLMTPRSDKRLPGFSGLARACNQFYLQDLEKDLAIIQARRFHESWVDSFRVLIDQMRPSLWAGDSILLRIGRHCGAEAVTIAQHRWIALNAPGRTRRFGRAPSTIWLGAERQDDRVGLLPFGWLLIERGDSQPSEALQSWCAAQPKPDLAAVQARLTAARAAAAQAARQAAEQRARQEQEAIAIAQVQAREAQLQAARSPNQREIHALALALREKAVSLKGGKDRPNTELHSRARRLAQRALDEAWPANERSELAHMLETELPKVVNLDMRDERKKLKIAALKDLAG